MASRRGASQPPELPGLRFERVLGSGGFSDVFLYREDLPARPLAVKVMLLDGPLGDGGRDAFVTEANLMAKVSSHPFIVTIHYAGFSADDRPYLAMEYCSGPTLAQQYKLAPFAIADALKTGIRIASAVATAHSVGILHRDIKPANILTNDFGWPALTDFGIASSVTDEVLAAANEEASPVGMSVPWSPPEMFDDHPKVDFRSDVFSLGATIYTLIAGRSPFEVPGEPNGTLDLMGRIGRGIPTPPQRTDVPPTLIAVLKKAMARRPEDRFATAIELARALQRVEIELGYTPTNIDAPQVRNLPQRIDEEGGDGDDLTRERMLIQVPSSSILPPLIDRNTVAPRMRQVGDVPAPPATAPGGKWSRVAQANEASDARKNGQSGSASRVDKVPAASGNNVNARTPRADDDTLVRVGRVAPQPGPSKTADGTAAKKADAEAEPKSRTNRIVLFSALAVVVLAVGAGLIGMLVTNANRSADPEPTTTATGIDDTATSKPPAPTGVAGVRQPDGHVDFTWVNPDPKSGDSYAYQNADGSTGMVPTDETKAELGPFPQNQQVCIKVWIRRHGLSSDQPGEACVNG